MTCIKDTSSGKVLAAINKQESMGSDSGQWIDMSYSNTGEHLSNERMFATARVQRSSPDLQESVLVQIDR